MAISESDLVHLIRLAIEGKREDVALYVRRLARRIRENSPATSKALFDLVKDTHGARAMRDLRAQIPVDLESRLELAKLEYPVQVPAQPILAEDTASALGQVVRERLNREALEIAELSPTRSLLFVGPPGVGKTLSAKWLANKLGMPMVTLDLAAVMSSFLGRTGNNLRNVLDYAKGVACVLLLDEFDAVAKRRDDVIEVGELKRLVTVLLQEIDCWPASGILIAATNHPELLDPAVWRRFDMVIDFELPTLDAVTNAVKQLLGERNGDLHRAIALVMSGISYSDIERDLTRAKRRAAVDGKPLSTCLESLIKSKGASLKLSERKRVSAQLLGAGYSQRRVSEFTGISRDTLRHDTSKSTSEKE